MGNPKERTRLDWRDFKKAMRQLNPNRELDFKNIEKNESGFAYIKNKILDMPLDVPKPEDEILTKNLLLGTLLKKRLKLKLTKGGI